MCYCLARRIWQNFFALIICAIISYDYYCSKNINFRWFRACIMWDSFYFVCLAVTFVYFNSLQYWQLHVLLLAIIAVFTYLSAVQPASRKSDCLYTMQDVHGSFSTFCPVSDQTP